MKRLILIPILLIAAIVILVIVRFSLDKRVDYDVSTANIVVPTFTTSVLDFDQQLVDAESLPFAASAVIDIDNAKSRCSREQELGNLK